jgi:hypothetical protein
MQYVMLHRPMTPSCFPQGTGVKKPSIYPAAAEKVREQENNFPVVTHRCSERLMYAQQA